MFHLNLAFSSLEAAGRAEVVRRCYRPMLDLARTTPFPIAIEATGWTLERVAEIDPTWIEEARELIATGHVELVGSAFSQAAAPLLPAQANAWNLKLGLETYERLLGVRPRLGLVCEQAYSPGLVELFAEAGYEGIVADWDNAYRSHEDWDPDTRRHPQRARAPAGSIPVVWSESIAFQKFQRFAHGELPLERYVAFVADELRDPGGSLLLYANDAEVFDHRPGRFAAEPELQAGEWERIADGLRAIAAADIGDPVLPSALLDALDRPGAGRELCLEAPDQPVPVKKQNKYNIGRWAVTGRDDGAINTRCRRIFERLRESSEAQDHDAWRELCVMWASDFRTHITTERWEELQLALTAAEQRLQVSAPAAREFPAASEDLPEVECEGTLLRIAAGDLTVVLNTRRGLAIESFTDASISDLPMLGTIEHGYFPTIELGADWYSGNLVQEEPLQHKITDLASVEPVVSRGVDGAILIGARVATPLGPIEKLITVHPDGWVELDRTLHWPELPPGSLRAGHMTLLPDAFDATTLWYGAHNGGRDLDVHELGSTAFDHGAAVSALVSSRQGLGVTEGVLLLGDAERCVRIEVDQSVATVMGLVSYQPVGDSFFLRAAFSLTESDDTRRGAIPRGRSDPQRLRMRLRASSVGR